MLCLGGEWCAVYASIQCPESAHLAKYEFISDQIIYTSHKQSIKQGHNITMNSKRFSDMIYPTHLYISRAKNSCLIVRSLPNIDH